VPKVGVASVAQRTDERRQYQLHLHYWNAAAQHHDPAAGDAARLAHSHKMRELILADFGGKLPTSILDVDRSADFPDPDGRGRSRQGVELDAEGNAVSRDQYGLQKSMGGRLSVFEGRLALNCIRLWSNPGDTVLDPFAGRGTRLATALELGRSYIGFDPSEDAALACERVAAGRPYVLHRTTALNLDREVLPNSVGLVFTCPPYWNSEFYGDNGVGLEGIRDYRDFVEELLAILGLAAEALVADGYLVVVIRGFYLHGTGIDTPAHLSRGLSALGLVLWDQLAHKMSTSRERFHQDVVQWRRTAQVHESVLVFRKSKPKKTRDIYRRNTEKANTKRLLQEDRLRQQRQAVLRRLGVDPEQVRPVVPVWTT
jgi:DNA modification methylase